MFLCEFFLRNFKQQIHFEAELSRDNVSAADIIVLSFCMALVCFPELQARQKGIVIGLVEDEYHFSALPSCFNDIIFISRRASLDRISRAVHRPVPRRAGGEQLEAKAAQSVSIKYYHPSKNALWPILPGIIGSADRACAEDQR